MRRLIFVLLLSAAATAAAAPRPVIKSYGPATIAVGSGERWFGITGSHFTSGAHGPVAVYSGPAGVFTVAPNALWGFEPEVRMQVWVPGEIVHTIGRYSVLVRNEATGDSDPVYFDVTGESRIILHVPPYLNVEATSPSGAVATYEASAESTIGEEVHFSCSPASGSTFPLGMTTVRCTGTMDDGATRSTQFVVTVIDRAPPVLTLPQDIVVEATENEGTIVHFETSATDIADAHVPVQCSPPSGSFFAIRATEVRCSATDDSRNSTIGSFTVTVTDDGHPTLTLPADITVEASTPDGTPVTFTATAHDEVDGDLPVSCAPASGATFPIGSTIVTCSATNTRAVTATGTFRVRVVDTVAPAIVSISATPDRLWPVNKRLIDVVVDVTAADDGDATPRAHRRGFRQRGSRQQRLADRGRPHRRVAGGPQRQGAARLHDRGGGLGRERQPQYRNGRRHRSAQQRGQRDDPTGRPPPLRAALSSTPLIRLRHLLPPKTGGEGSRGEVCVERPSPLRRGEKVPKADEGSPSSHYATRAGKMPADRPAGSRRSERIMPRACKQSATTPSGRSSPPPPPAR